MLKSLKKFFKRGGKEEREEKKRLVENEEVVDLENGMEDEEKEEETEQKPYATEDRVRARFVEHFDGAGNAHLIVKPPEVWYPNTNTDEFGWYEDSGYNTPKFQRIWQWIETGDDCYRYSFDEEGDDDYCFVEEERKNPKPRVSGGGKEWMNTKERTDEWLERSSKQTFPEDHYEMGRFENEWWFFFDYEWTVPEDECRFGVVVTTEDEEDEEWDSTQY